MVKCLDFRGSSIKWLPCCNIYIELHTRQIIGLHHIIFQSQILYSRIKYLKNECKMLGLGELRKPDIWHYIPLCGGKFFFKQYINAFRICQYIRKKFKSGMKFISQSQNLKISSVYWRRILYQISYHIIILMKQIRRPQHLLTKIIMKKMIKTSNFFRLAIRSIQKCYR